MSAEGFLPPIVLELRAKAGEFKSEMKDAQKELKKTGDEAEHSSGRMSKAFHGAATAGKVVTFALAGAALAVGGYAVEAALAAQKSESNLDTALKNAGSSAEELKPQLDAATASSRALGYANADTNQALAAMTVALGSPKKALADLGLAQDIARLKGISLAQAGILVAKAAEGQTKGLKALGIDLPVAAGGAKAVAAAQAGLAGATQKAKTYLEGHSDALNKSSKFHLTYMQMLDKVHAAHTKLTAAQGAAAKIMEALRSKVGGTAAAYGDTLSGKVAAAHAQLDSMAETLGNKLIPVITSAIGWGTRFVTAIANNKPALIAVSAVIGTVLVGAITAYIASLVIAGYKSLETFGKMGLSAAKWAAENVAAFAAVVAKGAVWAAETVAQVAMSVGAWVAQTAATTAAAAAAGVMTAAQWLLNAALAANPVTLVILGVVALIAIFAIAYAKVGWFRTGVQAVFHAVVAGAQWLIGAVRSAFGLLYNILSAPFRLEYAVIKGIIERIPGVFHTVVGAISNALSNVGNLILAPFKWAFNMVATIWDNTIGQIGFDLPSWLGGGSFHMPQIPHMAKGGIVPATPGGRLVRVAEAGQAEEIRPLGSGGSGGGPVHLHVHFDGPILARPAEAQQFARALLPHIQTLVLQTQKNAGFNPLSGLPA